MPDHIDLASQQLDWQVVIDVNVHDDVERLFLNLGAVVYSAKRDIAQDAPDDVIDEFARRRGCIIVSHDRRFMQLIQRRLYQRDIPARLDMGGYCFAAMSTGKHCGCRKCFRCSCSTEHGP